MLFFLIDSGQLIAEIDFYGNSTHGKIPRIEYVKVGVYLVVWSHFFKDTSINLMD